MYFQNFLGMEDKKYSSKTLKKTFLSHYHYHAHVIGMTHLHSSKEENPKSLKVLYVLK